MKYEGGRRKTEQSPSLSSTDHWQDKEEERMLKEENLNTYLVSHGWTHPLLEKIEIIKEDNISCLSS